MHFLLHLHGPDSVLWQNVFAAECHADVAVVSRFGQSPEVVLGDRGQQSDDDGNLLRDSPIHNSCQVSCQDLYRKSCKKYVRSRVRIHVRIPDINIVRVHDIIHARNHVRINARQLAWK